MSASSGLARTRHSAVPWMLLLAATVTILFLTAPQDGDFWWSDAPRHALNGVFLLDLLREMPLGDPVGFAERYYAQYPALSILFYPPLFPLTEAAVYALFGVSHFSAQLTVALYWAALAAGVFVLARRWLSPAQSFAAAVLFASVHETACWGRQVMLEIPVYTWLVWSAVAYLRYLDTRRPPFLFAFAALALGALYTKQTAVFLIATLGGLLVWETRGTVLRNRNFWIAVFASFAALVPLALMTVKFGLVNVKAAQGETGQELSRFALANWTYYLEKLPDQLGWPVLLCALLYPIVRYLRPGHNPAPSDERMLGWWVLAGYVFFSLVALKEPRHSLLILLPLVLFAVTAVTASLPRRLATPVILLFAAAQLGYAVLVDRPPTIGGYERAAALVADRAPKDSLVLFSGYRDGSFVFNMRSREDRRDLAVLRADKLLLKVKIKRELGVEERGLTAERLSASLDRYGVSYVVNQPNFWDDLPAMRLLQDLLRTPQFEKIGEIPVTGNIPHADQVLEIYRNRHYQADVKERPRLELLIIDKVI